MLRRIVADGVFVAAQNVHRVAADAQARSGHKSRVDGVAHGGIGRASALRPHVALGREIRPSGRPCAASTARMVRCGTDSWTVCRSSAPGCRNRCTCASIRPGSSVRSPKSTISASGGCVTAAPTSTMRSPVTSTSPGASILPDSTSSRRAARSTMGFGLGGCANATPLATSSAAQNRNLFMMSMLIRRLLRHQALQPDSLARIPVRESIRVFESHDAQPEKQFQ